MSDQLTLNKTKCSATVFISDQGTTWILAYVLNLFDGRTRRFCNYTGESHLQETWSPEPFSGTHNCTVNVEE